MMTTLVTLAFLSTPPPELGDLAKCKDSRDIALFVSPRYAHKKAPLRIIATSETPIAEARLAVRPPKGPTRWIDSKALGGPPFGWVGQVDTPAVGHWRVALVSGNSVVGCQKTRVRKGRHYRWRLTPEEDPVWRAGWRWERDTENLFSIWVEHLFDEPTDKEPTWRPMHVVTRNSDRNFLFNHLNLKEDDGQRLRLKPDCADFPYYLRAYFAWKLRLPFGARSCSRGSVKRAPSCGPIHSNLTPAVKDNTLYSFRTFILKEVANRVHSSSGRTAPKSNYSDYYPVKLERNSIRPGTVFNDPYGHVLVVQKWIPQTNDKPGILFAVDAQPDGTIGRRRFWKGSFLFPEDGAVSGAGFKRFRPLRSGREKVFPLSNRAILRNKNYADFSLAQWERGNEAFYEQMDKLINPIPLPPNIAMKATLDALTEQIRRRVVSIDTCEEWKKTNPGTTISMPQGTAIFQTKGAWESYSTPSRDMRLLIAIQTAIDYAARVKKYPERFKLANGQTAETASKAVREYMFKEAATRSFTYTRSDGSPFKLTVSEVIKRRKALEMAYNPNDCPERRWGAPQGSDELSTCNATAPEIQRSKMLEYRPWFSKRRRPIR